MYYKRRRNPSEEEFALPINEETADSIGNLLLQGSRVPGIAYTYGVKEDELRAVIEQMVQKWPNKRWVGFDYVYEQGELGKERRETRRQEGLERSRKIKREKKISDYAKRIREFIAKGPRSLTRKLNKNYLQDVAKSERIEYDDLINIFEDMAHQHPKILGKYFIDVKKLGYEFFYFTTDVVFKTYIEDPAAWIVEVELEEDEEAEEVEDFLNQRKFIHKIWLETGIKEGILPNGTFEKDGEPVWSIRDMGNLEEALRDLWAFMPQAFEEIPVTDEELNDLEEWWKHQEEDEKGRKAMLSTDDVIEIAVGNKINRPQFYAIRQAFPKRFPTRVTRFKKLENPYWNDWRGYGW